MVVQCATAKRVRVRFEAVIMLRFVCQAKVTFIWCRSGAGENSEVNPGSWDMVFFYSHVLDIYGTANL